MNEAVGIGLDLDDVVQRASASSGGRSVARPALHVRLRLDGVPTRRVRALDLSAAFADAALALAEADACRLVRPQLADPFALWREAATRELSREEAEVFRGHLRDLLERLDAGDRARIAVAIPDPADEVAQERRLRLLAGIGRVDPVWRPVLAALGLVTLRNGLLRPSFTLLAVEVGWQALRANVLKVERDPETGLHVPERQRPGVDVNLVLGAAPPPKQRIPLVWTRDAEGRLVRTTAAPVSASPETVEEVQDAAEELGAKLRERLDRERAGPVVWLVEGALAGVPCGPGRLGGAVLRGLRQALPEPAAVELFEAGEGLVARGGAECARRLAQDLPAWWDALPQLEINRRNAEGSVEFVPLVHAPRIAGGATYAREVTGFALPAGAEGMRFVLLHEYHRTARRLDQPLDERLPARIPVKLVVRQQPARGRARVDVVPVEPTPHFRPVQLDWDRLSDTGWDRRTALRELQATTRLRFPPRTPVPAGLHHWRATRLPEVLRRFLSTADASGLDYDATASACLDALRATRPPGEPRRVGAVSSDGEPHARLSPDERELLQAFQVKLDRDIRALPYGNDTRRRLVLAGAWLYAAAPPAVHEDLRLALERRDHTHGTVQAAGRSLSDELNVRLFFARCAEVFRQEAGNTDWAKALGQILLYREDACLWLDAERARLCLYGAVRELERALLGRGRPRPQIFNNAILALLGLLRVRRHIPTFLLGGAADPVPAEVGRAIGEHLDQLAGRLDRVDPRRAKRVREVLRYLEGKGTDQLVAAHFDD